jgi:hypothetical protein
MATEAGAYTDGYTIFRGSSAENPLFSSYSSASSGPVVQGNRRGLQSNSGDGGFVGDASVYPIGNDFRKTEK